MFDEVLPSGVRQLPGDLAVLDGLLGDPALLEPVQRAWPNRLAITGARRCRSTGSCG